MKQQTIQLGDKKLTLQDLDTRSKLEFQQTLILATGELRLIPAVEYILKYVIVKPQGLKIEDFDFVELNVLLTHVKDFLGLEGKSVIINVIE